VTELLTADPSQPDCAIVAQVGDVSPQTVNRIRHDLEAARKLHLYQRGHGRGKSGLCHSAACWCCPQCRTEMIPVYGTPICVRCHLARVLTAMRAGAARPAPPVALEGRIVGAAQPAPTPPGRRPLVPHVPAQGRAGVFPAAQGYATVAAAA
jgi:hypothetical protein